MALALGSWGLSLRLPCLLAWGSGFLLSLPSSLLPPASLSEGLVYTRLQAVSNILVEIPDDEGKPCWGVVGKALQGKIGSQRRRQKQ